MFGQELVGCFWDDYCNCDGYPDTGLWLIDTIVWKSHRFDAHLIQIEPSKPM